MTAEPAWLYRIEALSEDDGLWYNDRMEWVFEKGIGQIEAPSRDIPMDYDERYQKDGRIWHSSAPSPELMHHWFSKENVENLLANGFQFYRYLATEYVHYEFETCFIKGSAIRREVVDYRDVWGHDGDSPERRAHNYDQLINRGNHSFLLGELTEIGIPLMYHLKVGNMIKRYLQAKDEQQ